MRFIEFVNIPYNISWIAERCEGRMFSHTRRTVSGGTSNCKYLLVKVFKFFSSYDSEKEK